MAAKLIALVDDDLSVRRALPRLLRSGGFEARAFASPEELVESGFAAEAACLVLDVHLGRVSGFELLERLRAAGVKAPAIFITAFDDAESRQRARRLGATGYLRKPFDGCELLDAVAQAISTSPAAS
jgi:FixJ family two-component response regulator